MIMRLFLAFGLILLGVTGYFTVIATPPAYQETPDVGEVALLQKSGVIPTGVPAENEEVEHGVFDVPPMDEVMLEAAQASGGMAGMDMGGMDMGGNGGGTMTMSDGSTMPAGDMAQKPDANAAKPADSTMKMADGSTMKMDSGTKAPDANATMPADSTMKMADGSTMKMGDMAKAPDANAGKPADATMKMADGSNMKMGDSAPAPGGLKFSDAGDFDREVTLAMSEWTFSNLKVDVKKGERIRFTVRNDGNILHEFMFMTMPAMTAVNYRAKRADWNLLEHEALFEQSLLLPGSEISFIVEVQQTGNWMFMCMLPYHMQMGMMGQMSTPGMAMKM